jgi:hypothetical protein
MSRFSDPYIWQASTPPFGSGLGLSTCHFHRVTDYNQTQDAHGWIQISTNQITLGCPPHNAYRSVTWGSKETILRGIS